jgi:diacylglycerol kinase family enzyme
MAGLLIVNPLASGVDERLLAGVRAALPPGTEVVRTAVPGEATALAHEASGRRSAVYVFGGDGTFNEVLNGIDAETPLGLIPGGGTSVLPRALGLPRDPVEAAHRIAGGRPRRIGLGRANGRRFGFAAGVGLDAELVRRVDSLGRDAAGRRPGDRAFVLTALRLLLEHRGRWLPALEVEGLGRAAFALVANCSPYTYAGPIGLPLAPEASFDGGLDLVAPVEVRPATLPRLAWYAVRGPGSGARGVLYRHDAERLGVRCDRPLPMQLDGEDVGDVEEVAFTSEPGAVVVLVP